MMLKRPYGRILLLFLYGFGTAFATETAEKRFDLPGGNAAETLPEFAMQAEREIMFPYETVAEIVTNPVKGRFSVREALDRMLSQTGLTVVEDSATGALMVKRATSPDPPPEPSQSQPIPELQDSKPMKQNKAIALLSGLFALVVAPADAQVVPNAATEEEEPVIELSPFLVSTDRDTGYQATNTLAGTRLNTPIEDVGSAISIYTKDFLEDISSTDHNEMLVYATGMEAAGGQGNMSGLTANIDNAATTTTREDPEGGAGFGVAIRTRGLGRTTRTRGFFITDIPSDSYNVDRVTVNRGPNAILFGVGDPAGAIDSSLMRANLRRDRNKVQFRYGDNDSMRTVIDVNRVLIEDKLAARVAGLYSREEYDQRPAFEEKKRLYGTVTYEPFKSTSIRANFETGNGNANRLFTVPPTIDYEAWELAGRQPFDWTFYDDPARNPNAASQNSQNFVPLEQNPTAFGDRIILVFNPTSTEPLFSFQNRLRLRAVPVNNVFHPVFNRDSAADNFEFIDTRNISGLANAWWPDGQAPAGLRGQTFTNYDAFNWRKQQLYQSARQSHSFNTVNIAIEQRGWKDRVGVELAYDKQRYHMLQREGGQPSSGIRIDTNVTLPTGEPNPNLGRPFGIAGGFSNRYGYFDRDGMRATAFLKYDFSELNESWGKWLGRHIVTGLVEQTSLEKSRGAIQYNLDGPAALQINPNILNGNRNIRSLVYFGPSIIGTNNPVRLESSNVPLPEAGDTFMTTYFDPASGSLVTAPTTLVEWVQSGAAFRDVVKSEAIAMQSYWLQEHLVTLVGWRRDRDFFENETLASRRDETRTGLNDPGTAYFGNHDFDFAGTPPFLDGNEIVSYSAVLKWPTKLVPLPGDATLSVFYNQSDNFTPTGGRHGTFREPLDSPTGETKEYGINISAFSGKLHVRINRFETGMVNQTIISGGLPTQIVRGGIVNTVESWTREGNRNPDNVAFMDAAIARMLSPLPSDFLQRYDFAVSGIAPEITTTSDVPSLSDTTDFTAKGMEAGIVYNPTRNWRIMANFAKAETIQTRIYSNTEAMLELMTPAFNSSVTDPVSGVTVNFRDIPKNGYSEGFGPANPPGANIQRFGEWLDNTIVFPLAGFQATDGQVSPEQRKYRVNFVTNYTFSSSSPFLGEKLDGFGIGGGYRWQSKIALGYPTSIDENGVAHFDINNPYWGPTETNVDAWISYKRKVWNNRINWKVQLNVKNLFGGTGLIAVRTQPWGDHAAVRIPPEKRWYLTNTFEF